MGDLEGVGRIYRPELNTNVVRSPHVDKTESDRHRRDQQADHQDEEPHDLVELHELEESEAKPVIVPVKPVNPKGHVDISA